MSTYDFVVGVNLLGLFHSIKTFVPGSYTRARPPIW